VRSLTQAIFAGTGVQLTSTTNSKSAPPEPLNAQLTKLLLSPSAADL